MNLDEIAPDVLIARGKYSTLRSEHRHLMEVMRQWSEEAYDCIRRGLAKAGSEEVDLALFENAEAMCSNLSTYSKMVAKLQAEIDNIKPEAWGKK